MNVLLAPPHLVGLLSAVYHSYYTHKNAESVVTDFNGLTLLDTPLFVEEDVALAKKVRTGIIRKGGKGFYRDIVEAYRSGDPAKDKVIFDYLRLFFRSGKRVTAMFDRPEVVKFNTLLQNVNFEVHRLRAFIRLQEMQNGVYYGFYSSDHDIIERLAPVYAAQFGTQKFVLHDYKRCKMAYFDGERICYSPAPEKIEIELSEQELLFQTLWKQYFQNVSIAERANKKQQNAYLPKRYRHFMNEF